MRRTPGRPRQQVLGRDAHACQKCGRDHALHTHHIIARSDGGADTAENLIALCAACHAEWHMVEMATGLRFADWLPLPTYPMLLALYQSLPPELRELADTAWNVRRIG